MKKKLKKLLSLLPEKIVWTLKFVHHQRYYPNFSAPKSFNEKVVSRILGGSNELFEKCADKVEVKNYVAKIVGKKYVIPNYYVSDTLTIAVVEQILDEHKNIVIKANHNSGPVYIIDDSICRDELRRIVEDINKQLTIDYGVFSGEEWYTNISRKVLIEKKLDCSDSDDFIDYKFHVFTDQESGKQTVFLQAVFDANGKPHSYFFDENFSNLPFTIRHPISTKAIVKPKSFDEMVDVAKKIAKPFSYTRVDLYNLNGEIFFGEITLAHCSGLGRFTSKKYDDWLGKFWVGDDT